MDMQDKDFDELFRSKLGDLAHEPSTRVWEGITEGLAPARKRQKMLAWLSVAASLLLAVGAWALFVGKQPPVEVTTKRPMASLIRPKHATPVAIVSPVAVKPKQIEIAKSGRQYAQIVPGKSAAHAGKSGFNIQEAAPETVSTTTAPSTVQPVTIAKAFVPDDVPLAVKSDADIKFNAKADPMADKAMAFSIRDTTTAIKRKHKIHNFGDLVNLVVDKLDKRKDKLIVFSSDDENDARITGVNLGVVKSKKGE